MVGHLHCMEKAVDDGMLCCIMLSSWPKRVDDGAKQDNIGMLFVSRVAPLFGCFFYSVFCMLCCCLWQVRFGWDQGALEISLSTHVSRPLGWRVFVLRFLLIRVLTFRILR